MDMKKEVLVVYACLALCIQGCDKEPSSHFQSMDRNADNAVTFVEWMGYYGSHQHPISNCLRSDFYEGDCNADDKLTWEEYYQLRFQRITCAPLMPPYAAFKSKTGGAAYGGGSSSSSGGSSATKSDVTHSYFSEYEKKLLEKEKVLMEKYHIVSYVPSPQNEEKSAQ